MMHMNHRDASHILTEFGFTVLESEIYGFLLGESPATGYRVAQALGKPAANTYKAIQTLERKGAILVEDGDSRLCRAVPSEELLDRLEREFNQKKEAASKALQRLGQPTEDERIYTLRSREQVIERARQMLASAETVALAVLFPELAEELSDAFSAAAARGVDVVVKTYRDLDIPGVEVIISAQPRHLNDDWPGAELQLVVDARQHLAAFLERHGKGVHQAVWSRSPFLGFVHHNGLATELALTEVFAKLQADAGRKQLLRAVERTRHPLDAPGCQDLMRQYGSSEA